jgi:hypothetical protein
MRTGSLQFVDALEGWFRSARIDDYQTAKYHAEKLIKQGVALVNDPDFRRCFETHCAGDEPKDALFGLCKFLLCIAEGKATALKQWVEDNSAKSA